MYRVEFGRDAVTVNTSADIFIGEEIKSATFVADVLEFSVARQDGFAPVLLIKHPEGKAALTPHETEVEGKATVAEFSGGWTVSFPGFTLAVRFQGYHGVSVEFVNTVKG